MGNQFTFGPMAHATLIYIIGKKLQSICAKFKMCTHPMEKTTLKKWPRIY
jgi:hypothetical protein